MNRSIVLLCAPVLFAGCAVETPDNINFAFDDDTRTATITGYYYGDTVIVPEALSNMVSEYRVTSIAPDAFTGCDSLRYVVLPDGLVNISERAFFNCTQLDYIKIPKSVQSIGANAFRGCKIFNDSNRWTDNALYIDNWLIRIKVDTSYYTIADTIEHIADGAFSGYQSNNPLTDVYVSNVNTHYTSECGILFNKEKSKLICYPRLKADTAYTIPESVTTIGAVAFIGNTSLKHVKINPNVTSIGISAFRGCNALKQVTLPANVTMIDDKAFSWCSSLEQVTSLNPEPPRMGEIVFDGVSSDIPLYVPKESVLLYSQHEQWSYFYNIIAIE